MLSSDLIRTIYLRHPDPETEGEVRLRGPFHPSHIRDLVEAGAVPVTFEVSTELNPEWVDVQDHVIYPYICPKPRTLKLQDQPAVRQTEVGQTANTIQEMLQDAMSPQAKEDNQKAQQVKEHHDSDRAKSIRGVAAVLRFSLMFPLAFIWPLYASVVCITLQRMVPFMVAGFYTPLALQELAWNLGDAIEPLINPASLLQIREIGGGFTLILVILGFIGSLLTVAILTKLDWKWRWIFLIPCTFTLGPVLIIAGNDLLVDTPISAIAVGLSTFGTWIMYIYSCYKLVYRQYPVQ